MQVGEAAGRQAAAARRELQERLALAPRHLHQHVHEAQEPGAEEVMYSITHYILATLI